MNKTIDQNATAESQESQVEETTRVKARKLAAPMYRGPNGETWSGRGQAPKWVLDATAGKAGSCSK